MKIAILSAVLGGNFETSPKDPIIQDLPKGITEIVFHRFTDEDFPPCIGYTPRLQYRIPKLYGWEMFPGYDIYIWLDGGMSLQRSDSVKWLLEQLGEADAAFFRHPQRTTIKSEVEHIEEKLEQNHWYITPRYKGGLHREFIKNVLDKTPEYKDENLYASTAFIYRNNTTTQNFMKTWWLFQSRYFTCDQVQLPYAAYVSGLRVNKIKENLFKIGYLSLVSHHK